MALDPTARTANVKDSLKKYFVDNIARSEGKKLTFDKAMAVPRIQGDVPANEWVSIGMEDTDLDTLSSQTFTIYCCTRQDTEYRRLAQLTDLVMGYLTDTTETDGMKRIPLYRSYPDQAWELLGAMLVWDVMMSSEMEASDETKFRILSVTLRWAAKV